MSGNEAGNGAILDTPTHTHRDTHTHTHTHRDVYLAGAVGLEGFLHLSGVTE